LLLLFFSCRLLSEWCPKLPRLEVVCNVILAKVRHSKDLCGTEDPVGDA
jgi:hypothetical protein